MNLSSSAARARAASAPPRAVPAEPNGRRRRKNATAIASLANEHQAANGGEGEEEEEASPSRTNSSSPTSSSFPVSRRAALALSLASAASGLLPVSASAAIVDPSAVGVDPLLEGGTVTLLKVRGDGRDALSLSEAVVLDTNRKVHAANGAPEDFPGFVRVGFDIKVVVPVDEDEEGEKIGEARGEGEGGGEEATTAATTDEASTSSSSSFSSTEAELEQVPSPASPPPPPPAADASIPLVKGYQITPEGLIYKDYVIGEGGPPPTDGQEVTFDYTAFNEAGTRIDSSFTKGRPASARIGVGAGGGLIPGFELGLLGMRPGGRRRLIVPPALGPPIGPQTFFSAKQCEVFDVQLRAVKSCRRRQVAMFSDVVCE